MARPLRSAVWLSLLALLTAGCATVQPRFSQEIAATFAQQPMRRMETDTAELYYPEPYRAVVERIAARLEQCLGALRGRALDPSNGRRLLLYFTPADFNNAYVSPQVLGQPLHSVLPLNMTVELFHLLDLGQTDIGEVGCHELVHYVQFEQVGGLWAGINWLFGDVLPPNAFVGPWFLEGIAQYYEGRLGRPIGRPHSPLYRGMFESGVASRDGYLGGGDLSAAQRELLPMRGHYLTGLHFVEYLARTYGEEKLWKLIDVQGRSWVPPLVVTLRFKEVYGKSIGALLDDYSQELARTAPQRRRPANQRVLVEELGYIARIAGSPSDGAIGALTAGRDQEVRLTVYEHDGSVRFSRSLVLLLPGRRWIGVSPLSVSGLSFTGDGRWLYLVNSDIRAVGDATAQLWKVDAHTGEVVEVRDGLRGMGGSIHPAGDRYVFVEVEGGTSNLVELDLATGAHRPLTSFSNGESVGAPAYSPDGARIAFARFGANGFDLYVREPDGRLVALTDDGRFNYAPRWVNEHLLLFAREHEGRLQAHVLDLRSGRIALSSSAPFAVLDPVPIGGGDFAFANREGWSWTLDAAPIVPPDPAAVVDAAAGEVPSPEPLDAENADAGARLPLRVVRDEPYSWLDHLFVPTLRVPFALVLPPTESGSRWTHFYALSLSGQDRLGLHGWALNGTFGLPGRDYTASIEYGTQIAAPWYIRAIVGQSRSGDITDRSGSIGVSRFLWTTPVSAFVVALDRAEADSPDQRARLIGPGAAIDYFAGESTPYGGLRRALGLAGSAVVFPAPIGTNAFADLSATVTVAPPLPLLRRHSLVASVRGRALPGAPHGLLSVGGIGRGILLAQGPPGRLPAPGPDVLLPGVAFDEPVRGYEDFVVRATRAAVVSASYTYPFVIDRGWASTLYLFPPLFVRQVDVQAFGAAAFTDSTETRTLRSAGAAIFARALFGDGLAVSLYYQLAVRFDGRLRPLHLAGISFE